MDELRQLLSTVPGSYDDFVVAMTGFASKSEKRLNGLIKYISNHPQSNTSDVIEYATFEMDLMADNVANTASISAGGAIPPEQCELERGLIV